jgi:hypothetical protein
MENELKKEEEEEKKKKKNNVTTTTYSREIGEFYKDGPMKSHESNKIINFNRKHVFFPCLATTTQFQYNCFD